MRARPVVAVRHSWAALALAVFMVAILPLCWSGGLTRRALENLWLGLPVQSPQSSNNNEEEREVHKNALAREEAGYAKRPPPRVVETRSERVRIAHGPVLLRSAQIPNPHPFELSTRLLI